MTSQSIIPIRRRNASLAYPGYCLGTFATKPTRVPKKLGGSSRLRSDSRVCGALLDKDITFITPLVWLIPKDRMVKVIVQQMVYPWGPNEIYNDTADLGPNDNYWRFGTTPQEDAWAEAYLRAQLGPGERVLHPLP